MSGILGGVSGGISGGISGGRAEHGPLGARPGPPILGCPNEEIVTFLNEIPTAQFSP
jgi:hypothetical protein